MGKNFFIAILLVTNCIPGLTQNISAETNGKPILLRGTIILPNESFKNGYVAIVNGRIASVSVELPNLPGAIVVNTNGIILPGFVDVHNHLRANVMPRWKPSRLYSNRYQWRQDPEFIRSVNGPISRLADAHFCDMNKWGELRALVGGTTSIMTTQEDPCIHGMVRNLDWNSGFYGTTELNLEHIYNVLDLPPASEPDLRAQFVGAAGQIIAIYESIFIHLAEGIDDLSKEEFSFVRSQSLLNPKGVIIHGIPLNATDFQAMADNGTALVWSPRSNLELYGQTANILAALDKNVEIALAPDWAVTGSSNILNELKVAAQWNRKQLGRRLTDRKLVDMVTSIPAHIAGVEDQVGSISAGLRADIVVINGDQKNPYGAVIEASATNVDLVFIEGVPIYGERKFMEQFWNRSDLEVINLSGVSKTLATLAATFLVSDVETRLQLAMEAEGVQLAPLTEPNNYKIPGITMTQEPVINSKIVVTGSRGEGKTNSNELILTALPNQGRSSFTLRTYNGSNEGLHLRILDISGRVVEVRNELMPNTTFQVGGNLLPGIYIVEVVQGTKRKMLKLTRQ